MQLVKTSFDKNHVSSRNSPSLESKQMFDKFVSSKIITKEIDITEINKKCIGAFIGQPFLSKFNKLNISGLNHYSMHFSIKNQIKSTYSSMQSNP